MSLVRPVTSMMEVTIFVIVVLAVTVIEVLPVIIAEVLTVIPLAVFERPFHEYPFLEDGGPLDEYLLFYNDRSLNHDGAFNNHRPFDHHPLSNDDWSLD